MRVRLLLAVLALLLARTTGQAAEVSIAIKSEQGTPLKNALVIVQDLNKGEHELFRVLTNDAGESAPHTLAPGLYRAIATYPYSNWQTSVREFLVHAERLTIDLRMSQALALDDLPVSIGQLTVHVLDVAGRPAAGARVLIRDADAHRYSERWGTTDAQGTTTLELTDTPSTLIVVYRDQIYAFPANAVETERTLRLK